MHSHGDRRQGPPLLSIATAIIAVAPWMSGGAARQRPSQLAQQKPLIGTPAVKAAAGEKQK
jgi:hypothetical protein